MPLCHIALGGNVGNVSETFRTALARLAGEAPIAVTGQSAIVRTRPVGPCAGGEFSNAAVEIETSLPPLVLLDLLQDLERRAGRVPGELWGPRPLDLDLIFYGDEAIDDPRLVVPHPACWYRRFVLDPLSQIAAGVHHPLKGITVAELRSRLLLRPLKLALAGSTPDVRQRLRDALSPPASEVAVIDWQPDARSPEPAILAWLGPPGAVQPPPRFEELPLVPRLDLSACEDPAAFLRGVLQAALG